MLKKYKAEQGYLYYGANLQNVPWMFAYMADNQKLWGRKITNAELTKKFAPQYMIFTSTSVVY